MTLRGRGRRKKTRAKAVSRGLVIYPDLIFVSDLVSDSLCLYGCARLCGISPKPFGIFVGGVIGGLYGAGMACLSLPWFVTAFLTVLTAFIMCRAAFGRLRFAALLRAAVLFAAVNLLLGGTVAFLAMRLRGAPGAVLPIIIALLAFPAVMKLSSLLAESHVKRFYAATLTLDGVKGTFTLLADTGDRLRDPLTGRPVMVLSEDRLRAAFPDETLFISVSDTPREVLLKRKWHMVYAGTVGGGTLLDAFVPDALTVNGQPYAAVIAIAGTDGFDGADGVGPAAFGRTGI